MGFRSVAPLFACVALAWTGPATGEFFTLVQSTPLTGLTSPSGVELDVSTGMFYLLDAAGSTNHLFPVSPDGTVGSGFSPGWVGQNFSQSGLAIDPVTGGLLVLRDLDPAVAGPGAEVYLVDPVSMSSSLNVDLDPTTSGEVSSIAIDPTTGNYLISEFFDADTSELSERTPAGAFVRTVLDDAALDSLGLLLAEAGSAIFPTTEELVFTSNNGFSEGQLFALDLGVGTTRLFFDSGLTGVSGLTFGPTGDLAIVDLDTNRLLLYDGSDADATFTIPEPTSLTMACVGVAMMGWVALRRRFVSKSAD